jgi:hypothetical protein
MGNNRMSFGGWDSGDDGEGRGYGRREGEERRGSRNGEAICFTFHIHEHIHGTRHDQKAGGVEGFNFFHSHLFNAHLIPSRTDRVTKIIFRALPPIHPPP